MGIPDRPATREPCILSTPDGRYTTLPHHKCQDISRPLIRKILNEITVTPEEFVAGL